MALVFSGIRAESVVIRPDNQRLLSPSVRAVSRYAVLRGSTAGGIDPSAHSARIIALSRSIQYSVWAASVGRRLGSKMATSRNSHQAAELSRTAGSSWNSARTVATSRLCPESVSAVLV